MPVIGFPEEGKPPPLKIASVGFPDPTPKNIGLRPLGALLIGIRSAGTPLTHTHTRTHARTLPQVRTLGRETGAFKTEIEELQRDRARLEGILKSEETVGWQLHGSCVVAAW
jgi:hypothetical protein